MQSIKQYRQLRSRVEEQHQRGQAKARGSGWVTSTSNPSDVENGRSASSSTSTLHPSGEVSPSSSTNPEKELAETSIPPDGSHLDSQENHDSDDGEFDRTATAQTEKSLGVDIGKSLTGIGVRRRTPEEGGGNEHIFVVGFQGKDDPLNPQNWSLLKRSLSLVNVGCIGWIVGFGSSIDSGALPQAAEDLGVSEITESLATALFLIAFGCGGLIAGPFSEEFGRNPVYIANLLLFMIFIIASGLAPNIGAQLVFRIIAGFFGSTPLTCAGGSVSDLFNQRERVLTFPIFAVAAFIGPMMGPIVGGFVGESAIVSWRWVEWITLIISGGILISVVLVQPETYAPILLKYKSQILRKVTGDHRYVAEVEIRADTFGRRVRYALYRPFLLIIREPIIVAFGLYMTIVYVILFTFLNGFTFVFEETYGVSQGLTGLAFLGIAIGIALSTLLIPLIYRWYLQELSKIQDENHPRTKLQPEIRLYWAMLGAPCIPVSLFWMGWTARPDVSVWSPVVSTVLFGFGTMGIFISCYQYVIDSYEIFAASALASVTVLRYVVSGGMVIAAIPMYRSLSVHWTLTLMGCLSALMVPVPCLLFKYGERIRGMSKFAVG